jgi:KaiC/GvpD/RAD55 family RecA-like ATPase
MRELSEFGYSFQIKIVVALLTDKRFTSSVIDVLQLEYFDNQAIEYVVSIIYQYYHQYHNPPTIDTIRAELVTTTPDDLLLRREIFKVIGDITAFKDSDDLRYVKEKTIDFCKNRELSNAILKSVELVKTGKYEEVKQLVDNAIKVGIDTNDGLDYSVDIDKRYTVNKRNPIPTGLPVIDELLQGGLSAGDIGFVVGPGGSGKSWVLSTISANAFKMGYNVLYISLELNANYVGVRHDSILTGLSTMALQNNVEYLKKFINDLDTKGDLRLEWYPTKSLSLIKLRSIIERRILLGKKPHLLVIDYVDLMKLANNKSARKDELLQNLCEELRGIGGEYDMAVWTASQANRSAHGAEVDYVSAAMIAESMGKHYTADFMISLLRKKKDIAKKRARFHVIKNRYGMDQIDLVGMLDTDHGRLEIYSPDSKEAYNMVQAQIEEETDVRSKIAKIYIDSNNAGTTTQSKSYENIE